MAVLPVIVIIESIVPSLRVPVVPRDPLDHPALKADGYV